MRTKINRIPFITILHTPSKPSYINPLRLFFKKEYKLTVTKKSGNPIGRPKNKKSVGRPKEDRGIMEEYRQRMLKSPKSAKVLESIFDAALNDDHKGQTAAWKLVVDRILPVSGFDKLAGTTTRSAITVNISGVPGVELSAPEESLEGDFQTIEREE